ncbi:hypothetical protein ACQ9A2_24995, partial [Raoultella ornithinolytica]
ARRRELVAGCQRCADCQEEEELRTQRKTRMHVCV